ncbi:MAG: hypothetical protein Q9207_004228 [Kuettlingeria erythrocarpa]
MASEDLMQSSERRPVYTETIQNEHPKAQHGWDIRTNLSGFASWLQAYSASSQRNLSGQGMKQLHKLIKQRRANSNYTVGADGLNLDADAEEALRLWEALPLQKDSIEWRRARERMIRDMLITRRLEQEMSKGFDVTGQEIARARLLICTNSTPALASQMKCAPYPNRPILKELNWDGAHIMFGEGAQTLFGVGDGVPEWKQEYRAYCERSKVVKQAKLAKRLESKKEKEKKKKKAQKARRRQTENSGPGASMDPSSNQTFPVAGGHEEDGGRDFDGSDEEYNVEESDGELRSDDHGPEPVEGIWR